MNAGKVLWFDEFKGYGYIRLDDGREVYFHATSVKFSGNLTAGSTVLFDVFETTIGWEASNVEAA